MIKAIFFDIDGTLLSFKTHKIPASTEKALQLLQEKGIKILVSTGRSYNQLAHIRYINFDGYITFNGGYCITQEGDLLYKNGIPAEDIEALIRYSERDPALCYSFMSDQEISINQVTPEIEQLYKQVNVPTPPVRSYTTGFDTTSVMQVNVFIHPEQEAHFMEAVMPHCIASRWTPVFADVNPAGQSKKVGMDIFLQHFGIDRSETMAFGDGGNDITMLSHSHIGISMGNANPEVKEIADYITSDVDDDGIWNALRHFQII